MNEFVSNETANFGRYKSEKKLTYIGAFASAVILWILGDEAPIQEWEKAIIDRKLWLTRRISAILCDLQMDEWDFLAEDMLHAQMLYIYINHRYSCMKSEADKIMAKSSLVCSVDRYSYNESLDYIRAILKEAGREDEMLDFREFKQEWEDDWDEDDDEDDEDEDE